MISVCSNFIERPLPANGNGAGSPPRNSQINPGALGRGIQSAVAVTTFFSLWAYIMPIFGGMCTLHVTMKTPSRIAP